MLTLSCSASSAFLLRRIVPIVLSPEIEPASDGSRPRSRRGAVLDSRALEGADCERSAACFATCACGGWVGAGGGGHRGGAREVDELLDLVDGALQPLLDQHSRGHPLRLRRVSKSVSKLCK